MTLEPYAPCTISVYRAIAAKLESFPVGATVGILKDTDEKNPYPYYLRVKNQDSVDIVRILGD